MQNAHFNINLRMLRRSLGLFYRGEEYSQIEFADMLNVSRSAFQKWEKGVNIPNDSNLANLSNRLKEVYGLDFSPEELISQVIKPFGKPEIVDTKKTHLMIPIVARVHAGEPCMSFDDTIRMDALPITKLNRQIECGVLVDGDSMEPTFYNGDALYCTKKFDPKHIPNNSIVIARVGEEVVIRRYVRTNAGFLLMADNQKYAPIVPNGKPIVIIARVVSSHHNHIHGEDLEGILNCDDC